MLRLQQKSNSDQAEPCSSVAVFIKTSPHASPSQVLNPQDRPNGLIKDFQACWSHSVPTLFCFPLLMFTDLLGLGTLQPLLLAATTAATIFSNPHRWMNIEPVLAIFSCESWRLLRITTLECSHPSGAAHNIIIDQLSTLSIQPISCRDAVAASLQDNAIVKLAAAESLVKTASCIVCMCVFCDALSAT